MTRSRAPRNAKKMRVRVTTLALTRNINDLRGKSNTFFSRGNSRNPEVQGMPILCVTVNGASGAAFSRRATPADGCLFLLLRGLLTIGKVGVHNAVEGGDERGDGRYP